MLAGFAHIYNLSTQEAEAGRLRIQGSVGYIGGLRPAWPQW